MNVFELTRALVDIESITDNERVIGDFLFEQLSALAHKHKGGMVERLPVSENRFNVLATWGTPAVTLSTHMDTVPPFFSSSEDDECIWGRGSCDTKGIIASMMMAAEDCLRAGARNLGLLFVVGEEQGSVGAYSAAHVNRGSRFLINGEPTENKLALGSKGALRYEIIASGRMAHSAYPELGESAIEKLIDALSAIRRVELPIDAVLGRSTLNIGTISGGRAPNVIPDYAKAEIFIRLVDEGSEIGSSLKAVVGARAEIKEVLRIPAVHLGGLDGYETTIVSYTTDIPAFAGAWGKPFLLGPGTIHVAHTTEERVPKKQLLEAVRIYGRMVQQLLHS